MALKKSISAYTRRSSNEVADRLTPPAKNGTFNIMDASGEW